MRARQCKQLFYKIAKDKKIEDKIQIGSKQSKNLKQLIGGYKSKPEGTEETPCDFGCFKCNKCWVACPIKGSLSRVETAQQSGKRSEFFMFSTYPNAQVNRILYHATCQK